MKYYEFSKSDIDNVPFNVSGFLGKTGALNWTEMSDNLATYFTITTGLSISEVGYDSGTKIATVKIDSSGGTAGNIYILNVKFLTTDGRVRNAKARIKVVE